MKRWTNGMFTTGQTLNLMLLCCFLWLVPMNAEAAGKKWPLFSSEKDKQQKELIDFHAGQTPQEQ